MTMSTAVSTRKADGGAVAAPDRVEAGVQMMQDKFAALLGAEIDAARFCRVAVNAIQQTKDMELVTQTPEGRQSVYDACLLAATDNLLLDKRDAALVVYNEKYKVDGKDQWRKVAKYLPMFQGLLRLARNSGTISRIICEVVRANDAFKVNMLADCAIHHEYPQDDPFADRGALKGVYAIAQFKDGAWSAPAVLSGAQVTAIRDRQREQKFGPWFTDTEEMWKKTAIRRLVKSLPRSSSDTERFDNAAHRIDDLYDVTTPALEGPARKQPMAAKLLGPAAANSPATVVDESEDDDDSGGGDDGPWPAQDGDPGI